MHCWKIFVLNNGQKKLLCTFQHCCWWQLCAVDISRRCLLRWPYFDFFVTTTTWPSLFFLSVQLRVESNLHEYWESKGQPLSQWYKINNPIRNYLKEKNKTSDMMSNFWATVFKVRTLWEGHKISKNLPPVLTKQLFPFSGIKTSWRFFQIVVAFSEKLNFTDRKHLLQLSVIMTSWVRVWVDLRLFITQFFDKVLLDIWKLSKWE